MAQMTINGKTAHHAQPCACGCAPCEDEICRLECLVRPQFFCGQLLTDTDLTALLTWAQGKFRLARQRHGWGVVCGLDVRCDPKHPASVLVGPGYAVDCCGNDIVVCETRTFDLSRACPVEECYDPSAPAQERIEKGKNQPASTDLQERLRSATQVDLYLRYKEEDDEPQAAYGRGCGPTPVCEPSRTRETFDLFWRAADARDEQIARRQERYTRDMKPVTDMARRILQMSPPDASARRALKTWIEQRALHFCFVRDLVDALAVNQPDQSQLAGALFWLLQDARNALASTCEQPDPQAGVPLARVWLEQPDAGQRCHILLTDTAPPMRRMFAAGPCWNADGSAVDLAPFIWRTPETATEALRAAGVPYDSTAIALGDWKELGGLLDGTMTETITADAGVTITMYTLEAEPWGQRVVGFWRPSEPTS